MEDPLLSFKTKLKITPVANIHEKVQLDLYQKYILLYVTCFI